MNGFYGDKTLANGKVWPYLERQTGQVPVPVAERFAGARIHTLRLENLADNTSQVIPFTLIGTDLGLIGAPADQATIHMAPAERFDVIVDFTLDSRPGHEDHPA